MYCDEIYSCLVGYQWLMTSDMNAKTYDIDKFIYMRIHQQWETFQANDNHHFNITLQMDTSSIKGFLSNIQAQLIWPTILSTSKIIKFSLTQIGNFSFRDIYFENPSDNPVLLQLILISHYSDPYSLIELLRISDKDIDVISSLLIYHSYWFSYRFPVIMFSRSTLRISLKNATCTLRPCERAIKLSPCCRLIHTMSPLSFCWHLKVDKKLESTSIPATRLLASDCRQFLSFGIISRASKQFGWKVKVPMENCYSKVAIFRKKHRYCISNWQRNIWKAVIVRRCRIMEISYESSFSTDKGIHSKFHGSKAICH